MRTGRWPGRATLACVALLFLIGATTSVEARSRHRIAYQSPAGERIFEGEAVDESKMTDGAIESEEANTAPQEDAYFTSRMRRQRPPRGNHSGWVDDDDDDDNAPRRVSAGL